MQIVVLGQKSENFTNLSLYPLLSWITLQIDVLCLQAQPVGNISIGNRMHMNASIIKNLQCK